MERMTSPFRESVTTEELNGLEYRSFEGEIFLVDNMDEFYRVLPELRKFRVLGFDTETKPTFKKGKTHKVSLLQLSSSGKAFLFRLNKIGLPAELAELLADSSVIKTGAAIHDDIKLLQIRQKFIPAGFIELQTLVGKYGIKDLGLKKMAAIILGFKISKRQQVTDWDAVNLTPAQVVYAATDAWICYEIYTTLINNSDLVALYQKKNEEGSGKG
jgi:ribonuclease D